MSMFSCLLTLFFSFNLLHLHCGILTDEFLHLLSDLLFRLSLIITVSLRITTKLLSETQMLFHYLTCASGIAPYGLTVTLASLFINAEVKTPHLPHFRVAPLIPYHFFLFPPSSALSSPMCKEYCLSHTQLNIPFLPY